MMIRLFLSGTMILGILNSAYSQFTLGVEPRIGLSLVRNHIFVEYKPKSDFLFYRFGLFVSGGYNTSSNWHHELKIGYYPVPLYDPRSFRQTSRSYIRDAQDTKLTHYPSVAACFTKRFIGKKRTFTAGLELEVNTLKAHGYDWEKFPFRVLHNYEGGIYVFGTSALSIGLENIPVGHKTLGRTYFAWHVGNYLNKNTYESDSRTFPIVGGQLGVVITYPLKKPKTPTDS